MTKPNAVEEIMEGAIMRSAMEDGTQLTGDILTALNAAGLAIVPHDWNHREEDWSLQNVSEWLER